MLEASLGIYTQTRQRIRRMKRSYVIGCLAVLLLFVVAIVNTNRGLVVDSERSLAAETKQETESEIDEFPETEDEDTIQREAGYDEELRQIELSNDPNGLEEMEYVYNPPDGVSITGKPIKVAAVTRRLLDELELVLVDELDMESIQNFPLALAASENHFTESLTAIDRVQHMLPGHTLYYYDIGLNEEQVAEVKRMCSVVYRKIDLHAYTPNVSFLNNYSFKAIIWQDMLLEFDAFLCIDASVRFEQCFTDEILPTILDKVQSSGIAMFHHSQHSIGAVNFPPLFDYIPTNQERLMATRNHGAGFTMVSRQRSLYENVLKWQIVCSLQTGCINPSGAHKGCSGGRDCRKTRDWRNCNFYAGRGCHRFDGSILNTLLANHFDYDITHYSYRPDQCTHIFRGVVETRDVQYCDDNP